MLIMFNICQGGEISHFVIYFQTFFFFSQCNFVFSFKHCAKRHSPVFHSSLCMSDWCGQLPQYMIGILNSCCWNIFRLMKNSSAPTTVRSRWNNGKLISINKKTQYFSFKGRCFDLSVKSKTTNETSSESGKRISFSGRITIHHWTRTP